MRRCGRGGGTRQPEQFLGKCFARARTYGELQANDGRRTSAHRVKESAMAKKSKKGKKDSKSKKSRKK
jgi:hypothetical protein